MPAVRPVAIIAPIAQPVAVPAPIAKPINSTPATSHTSTQFIGHKSQKKPKHGHKDVKKFLHVNTNVIMIVVAVIRVQLQRSILEEHTTKNSYHEV